MGYCIRNAFCDFCDARCPDYIVDEKDWEKLCSKYHAWCLYEEIKGMQYVDAMKYMKGCE